MTNLSGHYEKVDERLQAIMVGVRVALEPEKLRVAERLAHHGEYGEALYAIAWLVVEEDARVSAPVLTEIVALSREMGTEKDLPLDLLTKRAT